MLTTTDRAALLRVASSLEKGNKTRRAILAGLRVGIDLEAWEALSDREKTERLMEMVRSPGGSTAQALFLAEMVDFPFTLAGKKMRKMDLSHDDMSGADLRGTDFSGSDLSDTDLSDADLQGANLSGADLSGADLSGANLSLIQFSFSTDWDDKTRWPRGFDPQSINTGRTRMARTLTASDRATLIRVASSLPKGDTTRRAILAGLSQARTASDDWKVEEVRGDLQKIIRRAVSDWEDAIAELYLNDLDKAFNQIDGFEAIADKMQERLGDLFSEIDGGPFADFYEEVSDEGHNHLVEAFESAKHEMQSMVDEGMADEGYEDEVQERMESDVLPVLEDAIEYFSRGYRVPRVASLKKAVRQVLSPGSGTEEGNVRYHRYMDSIHVTDLTNAGKRGKKVDQFVIYDMQYMSRNQIAQAQFERWLGEMLQSPKSYQQVRAAAVELMEGFERSGMYPLPKMQTRTLRGVDVDPSESVSPRFKELVVDTPERTLSLDVKPSHISIREVTFTTHDGRRGPYRSDRALMNERGSRKTKKMYQWVVGNIDRIRDALRSDQLQGVRRLLDADNIPYDITYFD